MPIQQLAVDSLQVLQPLRATEPLLQVLAAFAGLIVIGLVIGARRRSAQRAMNFEAQPWHSSRSDREEALPNEFRFLRPKRLLSKTELSFFSQLRAALPEYEVFPQVAFRAVVHIPSGLNGRLFGALARSLGARHADFLVCAKDDCRILAFIELDDPSHDQSLKQHDDRKRDWMLAAAGYKTIRFHTRQWPDRNAIRTAFQLTD